MPSTVSVQQRVTDPPTMWAGAAQVDITPDNSQFLYGYRGVRRYSQGVHDRLMSSALYLSDRATSVLLIANDLIWLSRQMADRVRWRLTEQIGMPPDRIMLTATHTHSGPVTHRLLADEADPAVPRPDHSYLRKLEDGLVEAGTRACKAMRPATLAGAITDTLDFGDIKPSLPGASSLPVLIVGGTDGKLIAVMTVCATRPTALPADWRLVSGDFVGLARQILHREQIGADVPFLYHLGASGDQGSSCAGQPRSIGEATRRGMVLAAAIRSAIAKARALPGTQLLCQTRTVRLPVNSFPSVSDAKTKLQQARHRLDRLRQEKPAATAIAAAEQSVLVLEQRLVLAEASDEGQVEVVAAACMPADVQVIRVGPWTFVGWPGDVSAAFAQEVMAKSPHTFVITLANGELQGRLVKETMSPDGGNESSTALFSSPRSGELLVQATLQLVQGLKASE